MGYPKPARDEGLSSLQSAQVNHRSKFLLLREINLGGAMIGQSTDHAPVQIRGGHFGRMAGQSPSIEAIEPAGMQIMPGTFGQNHVITDAILAGLSECTVGDLKHAERA